MPYSLSTLLTRNLTYVFGENDSARRRVAIEEIFTEDCVFYEPNGVHRGHDEIDRVAGELRTTHSDFRYQPIAPPEELGNAGRIQWVEGRPGEAQDLLLDQYSRRFLLLLSGINLALGLIFYAYPPIVISYWPWPVKELAIRFIGAIFLAIAFGCWSAVRAERWQRAKILVLVGGTFFGITGIVSLVRGITVSSDASTWVWTGYFLIAAAGCLLLLQRYGWHRRQAETPTSTMPSGARLFFGIQTSVVGIFGIMMLLVPGLAQQEFWPWKVNVSTLQTFAALFLATCLATGWATQQKDPERIKVLLPLDAVFPSLALLAVAISWNVIVAESPSWLVTGVWVGLYSFVAAGSTVLYFVLTRRSR